MLCSHSINNFISLKANKSPLYILNHDPTEKQPVFIGQILNRNLLFGKTKQQQQQQLDKNTN